MAALVATVARASSGEEAGFVVRMEGTWTYGPPPGTPLGVGEIVRAGMQVHPPAPPAPGARIEIALYQGTMLLRRVCDTVVGCAPLEVPKRKGSPSGAQRVLKAVQSLFLEHPQRFEYAIARSAPSGLELQPSVLGRREGGFVAAARLSADESGEGRGTFPLRKIDGLGRLGAIDPTLSITVERAGGSEDLVVHGDPEPGLYNVWDQKGLDERPAGAPATLGTWVLVAGPDRAAVLQKKFREAADSIRWGPEGSVTRATVLRAYLMYLFKGEEN